MVCFRPVVQYVSRVPNSEGKKETSFVEFPDSIDRRLPCRKCTGCRIDSSREWATRCIHESQMWDDKRGNSFITLTYDDEHLPMVGDYEPTLVKKHFQDFMKRLRKHFCYPPHIRKKYRKQLIAINNFYNRKYNRPRDTVRYFMCGEYGSQYGRPHYHALLFNCRFDDLVLYKKDRGVSIYTSDTLKELWPYGFSSVGEVTFQSAAYVARYCMKKVTGDDAYEHYMVFDEETGEVFGDRVPEYCAPSRRPGLGKTWLEKFHADVYSQDFVVVVSKNGDHKVRVPRFYDAVYECMDPNAFLRLKEKRAERGAQFEPPSFDRLKVMEVCKKAEVAKLVRSID